MEYPKLCRRPVDGGTETILLDGDREAKGKPFWDLGCALHSPDHTMLAYTVDAKGSELYVVRIRDLASGKDLPDVIRNTSGEIVWANDSRTLFYTRLDANHRPLLVYRHTVGMPAADDVLVYQERDPGFDVNVDKTHSGAFILIEAEDHQTSEVWLVDADAPATAPRRVFPREDRPPIFRRASRRRSRHHHEFRRGRGLPDLRDPGRCSRHERLARDRSASPRSRNSRDARLSAASGATRAGGRLAAHRDSSLERRRRACDRLRRGGLCAGAGGRIRLRYRYAALRLFLHDDARAGVRLRHGDAYPRAEEES